MGLYEVLNIVSVLPTVDGGPNLEEQTGGAAGKLRNMAP